MSREPNRNQGASYSNRWDKTNLEDATEFKRQGANSSASRKAKPYAKDKIQRGKEYKSKEQKAKGANFSQASFSAKFHGWRIHHAKMFVDSLNRLLRTPLASLVTLLVIAIAIALPAGLYLFLSNAQLISSKWDGTASISLYLRSEVTPNNAKALLVRLNKDELISSTEYISKEDALKEFKEYSGFGEALNYLDGNPLPSVILVKPKYMELQEQEILLEQLKKLPEVEEASLDLAWVKRLYYIMEIANRIILVLSILLGLAVLLIVGNTIRLAIDNRRQEIVVIKLVGATNAFVRRPFLYTGFWYGLGGGLLAWLLLFIALLWLKTPVNFLATSYSSDFSIMGLNLGFSVFLICIAIFLGLAGAWLAVGKHIKQIEMTR